MKAFVYSRYGSPQVLELKEVAKPNPKEGEVLVKIQATALNAADYYLLKGEPFLLRLENGLNKPKNPILGADIAGTVESVGSNTKQFKVGDAVYGDLSSCGWGGLAEYVAVPEKFLAPKPHNLSFEEAAAVPMAAITALQGLRDKGHIQAGQKVLINGASGGVGTFAVQIAKSFGAEVTAVASSSKLDMLRSIGADHVIDYTKEDFTKNGQRYDLIIGANGHRSLTDYKRSLSPNGVYVVTGGAMAQIFQAMLLGRFVFMGSGKKIGNLLAKPNQADLLFMKELLEAGKVVPIMDQCYSFKEVPEALSYVGKKHAKGKVVISMEQTKA